MTTDGGSLDDASWLFWLLRTHDSFYPTGGYAHSLGLEPLVQEGFIEDVAQLRSFLEKLALPSLLRTDLPIFAEAWRAAVQPEPWPELKRLAQLQHACRASAELRKASLLYGRQRLQTTASLKPDGLCARFLPLFDQEGEPTSASVAAALDAHDGGVPLQAAAAGLLYASLVGYIAAAGKLLRLGQRAMQKELEHALNAAQPGFEEALRRPASEAGWTVPWWDLLCLRHESASARMFLS